MHQPAGLCLLAMGCHANHLVACAHTHLRAQQCRGFGCWCVLVCSGCPGCHLAVLSLLPVAPLSIPCTVLRPSACASLFSRSAFCCVASHTQTHTTHSIAQPQHVFVSGLLPTQAVKHMPTVACTLPQLMVLVSFATQSCCLCCLELLQYYNQLQNSSWCPYCRGVVWGPTPDPGAIVWHQSSALVTRQIHQPGYCWPVVCPGLGSGCLRH